MLLESQGETFNTTVAEEARQFRFGAAMNKNIVTDLKSLPVVTASWLMISMLFSKYWVLCAGSVFAARSVPIAASPHCR